MRCQVIPKYGRENQLKVRYTLKFMLTTTLANFVYNLRLTEQQKEDKRRQKGSEKEVKEELRATKDELGKAYEDIDELRRGNDIMHKAM